MQLLGTVLDLGISLVGSQLEANINSKNIENIFQWEMKNVWHCKIYKRMLASKVTFTFSQIVELNYLCYSEKYSVNIKWRC